MPQIIVTAGNEQGGGNVTLRERVNASDFESERFAENLVERLGWAVLDAVEAERETGSVEPAQVEEPEAPQRQAKPGRITGERRRAERGSHLEPVGSA